MRAAAIELVTAVIFALVAWPGIGSAVAETEDDALLVYGVNIIREHNPAWTGHGIYLGNSIVVTAAHVLGRFPGELTVSFRGLEVPAHVVRLGTYEADDLTVLQVEDSKLPVWLRMRRAPLCDAPPRVGQPVVTVTPEATAPSRIVSPGLLSRHLRLRFPTLIGDVATTGNSGSGVFDANRGCLMGIMSRKFQVTTPDKQVRDIAKYFVPASVIRRVIAATGLFDDHAQKTTIR